MKKRLSFFVSFVLCLMCASSVSARQVELVSADDAGLPSAARLQLQRHRAPKPVQLVNQGNFAYYEDFEECVNGTSYDLPTGWKSIATPGDSADVWAAGSVMDYYYGTLLQGADGGTGMGVLLGNSSHNQDAWAITPTFTLEAGKEYRIKFYVWFLGWNYLESLNVWLGTSQDVTSMTTCIDSIQDAYQWTKVEYTIKPETTQQYCIGFHGESTAGADAVLIDYISVASGPVFYGEEEINFPETTTLDGPQTMNYSIYNAGIGKLEVTLDEEQTSPEITVTGLPLSVEADNWDCYLSATLDIRSVGDYTGRIVLHTNDPDCETVVIKVTETVTESYVTGRWFEDFTKGKPQTWNISGGYFSKNDGLDGSMSLWGNTVTKLQYTTPFTQMGSNPKLSFYYRPQATDFRETILETTADMVVFYVKVFESNTSSWDTIYTVSPEVNPYTAVEGMTRVDVDLSKYANKTCQVCFDIAKYYVRNKTTNRYCYLDFTLDNIELGTKSACDASVKYLDGERNLRVGEPATMNAMVRNSGTAAISGYTVRLVDDAGTVLATADGPTLAAEEMSFVALTWTPEREEMTSVHAEVVLDGDTDDTYNKTNSLSIAVAPASAQQVVVGDMETASKYAEPLQLYNEEVATQSLYLASDLSFNDGVIYGLKYHVTSPNQYISEPVQIWIGETTQTEFSDQFIDVSTLTKVHDGRVYLPESTNGDVCIAFDKPYQYHGGNLVVYAFRSASYFVLGRYFYGQSTDANRTITALSSDPGTILPETPQEAAVNRDLYQRYPIVEFMVDVAPGGVLYGTVTNAQGEPVEGATVTVSGTQLQTTTDANGNYSFKSVTYGNYDVKVTYYGYTDATAQVTIDTDSVRQDFVLALLPTYTVSGLVTDKQNGDVVSGALVRLIGYDNYIGTTDAQGHYEIQGVYATQGQPYDVAISAPYYKNLTTETLAVDTNMTANYQLEEQNFPVRNAELAVSGGVTNVTWEKPLPEYRYDAGVPNGSQRGFVYVSNYATAVLGAAYRHTALIRDIEWYLTSESGPHDNINIIIFGLNANGMPGYNILHQETAASTDLQWNIYELSEPVYAPNGFCVSLSYSNGYLALSESSPTDEYPAVTRSYFYHNGYDNEYTDTQGNRLVDWGDNSSFTTSHLMLRAVGEDYGLLDNEFVDTAITGSDEALQQSAQRIHQVDPVSYTIYRLQPGQAQSEWELVATGVTTLEYTDVAFADLPTGDYQYAIVANYLNGDSDYRLTNILAHTSGVTELNADDASMLTDGNVYTVDGRLVSTNGTAGLDAGIYIMNGNKVAIIK